MAKTTILPFGNSPSMWRNKKLSRSKARKLTANEYSWQGSRSTERGMNVTKPQRIFKFLKLSSIIILESQNVAVGLDKWLPEAGNCYILVEHFVGHYCKAKGRLAQLVEHGIDVLGVRGSSPLPPTKTELNGFFKVRRWDARSASH